jgi:hypothetical protein
MAEMCTNIILPIGYDSSSIARKILIGDGFSYLKGDEWRVFAMILSPLLLKGRLDLEYYENWMKYVEAIQIMCMPSINLNELNAAHKLMQEFCVGYTHLYGAEAVVSNIHFHMHLRDSILSYGPMPNHWTFYFERCNGGEYVFKNRGMKYKKEKQKC